MCVILTFLESSPCILLLCHSSAFGSNTHVSDLPALAEWTGQSWTQHRVCLKQNSMNCNIPCCASMVIYMHKWPSSVEGVWTGSNMACREMSSKPWLPTWTKVPLSTPDCLIWFSSTSHQPAGLPSSCPSSSLFIFTADKPSQPRWSLRLEATFT